MTAPATSMSVGEVMVAVADQLTAQLGYVVEGLQVDPRMVRNPTPPCIDIYPADPFLERTAFGPGSVEAVFIVRARVTTADQQDGQWLLLQFMDPGSNESIWRALETDATFGGAVDDSAVESVSGFRPDEVAGTGGGAAGALLGAEWRLRVEL